MGSKDSAFSRELGCDFLWQLFAAIKARERERGRDSKIDSSFLACSQSFSISSKSKWTGVKADFQAYRTENEMISSGWKPNEWMHFWFWLEMKLQPHGNLQACKVWVSAPLHHFCATLDPTITVYCVFNIFSMLFARTVWQISALSFRKNMSEGILIANVEHLNHSKT